jgi:hypothetical protein
LKDLLPLPFDARLLSSVFLWHGSIDHNEIAEWIRRRGWLIPKDLIEFWAATGGGEIFESESVLRPLISPDGQEEVEQVTQWCVHRGMPPGLIVFHQGLGFTATRSGDGMYVSLDTNFRISGLYSSLDKWYVKVLRAEYAARYGLPPLV